MPPIKIETEGVVEFELTTLDGKETRQFFVDAGKAAFAIKAITDECGEDDRMVGEKVHELVCEILGEPDVRFSFFTINAFARAVMEVANETKKKIWGDVSQDEPPGTDSTS